MAEVIGADASRQTFVVDECRDRLAQAVCFSSVNTNSDVGRARVANVRIIPSGNAIDYKLSRW
ncbi:hypothetical protein PJN36_18570 [Mycobacterium kansasii]|uniref:Uncharacterized protein n=3 Tax=Mycobacterium kansasii TaxID=1768 RepID=A0A1V3WAY3_MYCKA|nr:hypothetical protein MKAN_04365 [Mycobacterium kansasii ATCC 12478]ARG58494.1 hypothetical protein B1T43_24780 [Mycobacterium kansasii]EUA00796.1 hypothetical protein I547_4488 [Mycobacterium kansasii 824]EUA19028.1 hypothetical protein I545_2569 [Mycobacterium kansasii 662]ARG63981.1 hypothetical protein B1T45_25160 [Mycobacterium kansasii]